MTTYEPGHVLGAQRNGLNHVSMNIGPFDRNAGPEADHDYPLYPDELFDWYRTKHVASARVMFTWEAVQTHRKATIPSGPTEAVNYAIYRDNLVGVVRRLLARDIYVVLCPWQYNPHSHDTDLVYDGTSFTADEFADFWGRFATVVNTATGNDARVAFDLINEPHTHEQSGPRPGDVGMELDRWFACAQAAITAIRQAGATNTILVGGMNYTAAVAFTTNGSAEKWLALTDVNDNLAVSVHCYTGLGSSSPTVLPDACRNLVDWARQHDAKVHIGEIALDAGHPAGSFATAQAQWAAWDQFCTLNRDVVIGWNWWANSAGGTWWNEGDSSDPQHGFHWGLSIDNGHTQSVYMTLIEQTLRAPVSVSGSALTSWTTSGYQHLAHLGADGHVHADLSDQRTGTHWTHADLGTVPGAAPAAPGTALTSWTTPDYQHLAYLGADNHIHELYFQLTGTHWTHADLGTVAVAEAR